MTIEILHKRKRNRIRKNERKRELSFDNRIEMLCMRGEHERNRPPFFSLSRRALSYSLSALTLNRAVSVKYVSNTFTHTHEAFVKARVRARQKMETADTFNARYGKHIE